MYEVIKYFTDLQDSGYPYRAGDTFPRKGYEVSEARLAELASDRNRQGEPLIKSVERISAIISPEVAEQAASPQQGEQKPTGRRVGRKKKTE